MCHAALLFRHRGLLVGSAGTAIPDCWGYTWARLALPISSGKQKDMVLKRTWQVGLHDTLYRWWLVAGTHYTWEFGEEKHVGAYSQRRVDSRTYAMFSPGFQTIYRGERERQKERGAVLYVRHLGGRPSFFYRSPVSLDPKRSCYRLSPYQFRIWQGGRFLWYGRLCLYY